MALWLVSSRRSFDTSSTTCFPTSTTFRYELWRAWKTCLKNLLLDTDRTNKFPRKASCVYAFLLLSEAFRRQKSCLLYWEIVSHSSGIDVLRALYVIRVIFYVRADFIWRQLSAEEPRLFSDMKLERHCSKLHKKTLWMIKDSLRWNHRVNISWTGYGRAKILLLIKIPHSVGQCPSYL